MLKMLPVLENVFVCIMSSYGKVGQAGRREEVSLACVPSCAL